MEIKAKSAERNLLLEFSGELDHHGARNALRELEQAVDAALPKKLVLDMAGVTFMDSSGIALIPAGPAAHAAAGWQRVCLQRAGPGAAGPGRSGHRPAGHDQIRRDT